MAFLILIAGNTGPARERGDGIGLGRMGTTSSPGVGIGPTDPLDLNQNGAQLALPEGSPANPANKPTSDHAATSQE